MKPMLAGRCTDPDKLKYPVLATPKLDGIRCLCVPTIFGMKNGTPACAPVTRSLKDIPNEYIRGQLRHLLRVGFDGELMCGNFQETSSSVMSYEGMPDFKYYVFDFCNNFSLSDSLVPYSKRCDVLAGLSCPPWMIKVLPVVISNPIELNSYEVACLQEGYEGVMIRSPDSPYKFGRSTTNEGWLLKIKRFQDSEAEVIEVMELMHNDNPQTEDALGHAQRSSHKDNMRPAGVMGSLRVRDLKTHQGFSIGTGFDDLQRAAIWNFRATYIGAVLKYKYQPTGVKDLPRFPVFLGWRSEADL